MQHSLGEKVGFMTPVAESAYLLEVDPVAKDNVWEEICLRKLIQVDLEEGVCVSDVCWNHLVKFCIVKHQGGCGKHVLQTDGQQSWR